ncbi:MAG: hypothetical protein LC723_11100, partial [Actinobacteria bacterium]|nr:hypothetical protein [Actinomycetota bacterium]
MQRLQVAETLASLAEKVLKIATSLPEDLANRPSTIGGGDWSANDLLGHLQTWEEVAIDAYQSW